VLAQPTENAPPEEGVLPAGHQGAVGGSYGDGVPERLAEAAATLVRRPVDVIATYGTPAKAYVNLPEQPAKLLCGACERHSHKPSPATVFDYSRALAQGDWCPGPALARGHVGRHRDLRVLDTSQVLYDVLAIGIPQIDAVSEMRAVVYRHFRLPLHRRRGRVLELGPVGRTPRAIRGPLAMSAFLDIKPNQPEDGSKCNVPRAA
jgi:hypothetical protein